MEKKAILLGASGLIGNDLLNLLLNQADFSEVLIIVRKKLNIQHPKLRQLIINLEELNDYAEEIYGDIVFCCIGTTKKQTPDLKEYKKIDYQYPLDLARIAHSSGAESYHLVSALGANVNSSIFYSRTKGEVERDLKTIPFKSLYIYRPSLLDGKRKNKRFGESIMASIMRFINPLLTGSLKKYRSIRIEKVAQAMLKESLTDKNGVFIYPSDTIEQMS